MIDDLAARDGGFREALQEACGAAHSGTYCSIRHLLTAPLPAAATTAAVTGYGCGARNGPLQGMMRVELSTCTLLLESGHRAPGLLLELHGPRPGRSGQSHPPPAAKASPAALVGTPASAVMDISARGLVRSPSDGRRAAAAPTGGCSSGGCGGSGAAAHGAFAAPQSVPRALYGSWQEVTADGVRSARDGGRLCPPPPPAAVLQSDAGEPLTSLVAAPEDRAAAPAARLAAADAGVLAAEALPSSIFVFAYGRGTLLEEVTYLNGCAREYLCLGPADDPTPAQGSGPPLPGLPSGLPARALLGTVLQLEQLERPHMIRQLHKAAASEQGFTATIRVPAFIEVTALAAATGAASGCHGAGSEGGIDGSIAASISSVCLEDEDGLVAGAGEDSGVDPAAASLRPGIAGTDTAVGTAAAAGAATATAEATEEADVHRPMMMKTISDLSERATPELCSGGGASTDDRFACYSRGYASAASGRMGMGSTGTGAGADRRAGPPLSVPARSQSMWPGGASSPGRPGHRGRARHAADPSPEYLAVELRGLSRAVLSLHGDLLRPSNSAAKAFAAACASATASASVGTASASARHSSLAQRTVNAPHVPGRGGSSAAATGQGRRGADAGGSAGGGGSGGKARDTSGQPPADLPPSAATGRRLEHLLQEERASGASGRPSLDEEDRELIRLLVSTGPIGPAVNVSALRRGSLTYAEPASSATLRHRASHNAQYPQQAQRPRLGFEAPLGQAASALPAHPFDTSGAGQGLAKTRRGLRRRATVEMGHLADLVAAAGPAEAQQPRIIIVSEVPAVAAVAAASPLLPQAAVDGGGGGGLAEDGDGHGQGSAPQRVTSGDLVVPWFGADATAATSVAAAVAEAGVFPQGPSQPIPIVSAANAGRAGEAFGTAPTDSVSLGTASVKSAPSPGHPDAVQPMGMTTKRPSAPPALSLLVRACRTDPSVSRTARALQRSPLSISSTGHSSGGRGGDASEGDAGKSACSPPVRLSPARGAITMAPPQLLALRSQAPALSWLPPPQPPQLPLVCTAPRGASLQRLGGSSAGQLQLPGPLNAVVQLSPQHVANMWGKAWAASGCAAGGSGDGGYSGSGGGAGLEVVPRCYSMSRLADMTGGGVEEAHDSSNGSPNGAAAGGDGAASADGNVILCGGSVGESAAAPTLADDAWVSAVPTTKVKAGCHRSASSGSAAAFSPPPRLQSMLMPALRTPSRLAMEVARSHVSSVAVAGTSVVRRNGHARLTSGNNSLSGLGGAGAGGVDGGDALATGSMSADAAGFQSGGHSGQHSSSTAAGVTHGSRRAASNSSNALPGGRGGTSAGWAAGATASNITRHDVKLASLDMPFRGAGARRGPVPWPRGQAGGSSTGQLHLVGLMETCSGSYGCGSHASGPLAIAASSGALAAAHRSLGSSGAPGGSPRTAARRGTSVRARVHALLDLAEQAELQRAGSSSGGATLLGMSAPVNVLFGHDSSRLGLQLRDRGLARRQEYWRPHREQLQPMTSVPESRDAGGASAPTTPGPALAAQLPPWILRNSVGGGGCGGSCVGAAAAAARTAAPLSPATASAAAAAGTAPTGRRLLPAAALPCAASKGDSATSTASPSSAACDEMNKIKAGQSPSASSGVGSLALPIIAAATTTITGFVPRANGEVSAVVPSVAVAAVGSGASGISGATGASTCTATTSRAGVVAPGNLTDALRSSASGAGAATAARLIFRQGKAAAPLPQSAEDGGAAATVTAATGLLRKARSGVTASSGSGGSGGGGTTAATGGGVLRALWRRSKASSGPTGADCQRPVGAPAAVVAAEAPAPAAVTAEAEAEMPATVTEAAVAISATAATAAGASSAAQSSAQAPAAWAQLHARAVDTLDGRRVLVLTLTDVTRQVQARERVASLVEQEHRILEALFPRHVIAYLTARAGACDSDDDGEGDGALTATGAGGAGGRPVSRAAWAAQEVVEASMGAGMAARAQRQLRRLAARQQLAALRVSELATSHRMVTILFSDIVGFTAFSRQVTPLAVMRLLNELYKKLDGMLDIYKVYKVETIGDCYVVAGGLVRHDEDGLCSVLPEGEVDALHAVRVMEFAKAMLRASRTVTLPTTGQPLQLRLGLHSGPAMSGVVGCKMPRFTVFGETVEAAHRMEAAGRPGRIHVSAATRALLGREEWEKTEGVQVDGRGRLDTYLWAEEAEDDEGRKQRVRDVYL